MDERQRRVDEFNAWAAGRPDETSYEVQKRSAVRGLHGRKDMSALFGEQSPIALQPFPSAGRRKGERLYNQEAVTAELSRPEPRTVDIDPRILSGSQPNVTRAGVAHYFEGDEYEKQGRTFADQHNVGNQFPFVVSKRRTRPNAYGPEHVEHEHVIISGHHRATAALLRGQRLTTRWLEEE